MRPRIVQILIIAEALALAGCCSTYLKEKTFSTQSEAGAIHVAVQSVAPFDEYIDSLQPHFDLTAADAYQKAIPETRLREIEELRAFAATLKVALSQIKTADTGTETRQAGDTEKLAAPPQASLPSVTPFSLPSETPSLDPALQYQAAASLFQEVALLGSYVRDAAVQKGTVPYVVRLLITAFPRARVSPYDFYATVSFFQRSSPADSDDRAVQGSKTWKQLLGLNLTNDELRTLETLASQETELHEHAAELVKLRSLKPSSLTPRQEADLDRLTTLEKDVATAAPLLTTLRARRDASALTTQQTAHLAQLEQDAPAATAAQLEFDRLLERLHSSALTKQQQHDVARLTQLTTAVADRDWKLMQLNQQKAAGPLTPQQQHELNVLTLPASEREATENEITALVEGLATSIFTRQQQDELQRLETLAKQVVRDAAELRALRGKRDLTTLTSAEQNELTRLERQEREALNEAERLKDLRTCREAPPLDRGEYGRFLLLAKRQPQVASDLARLKVLRVARDVVYLRASLKHFPCGSQPIDIIPLFATVRYETSLESAALGSQTTLGLSLGGSLGSVGAALGAASAASDEQRTLSRAINSPFSVARVTTNTLQARLAALFAGTKTGYVSPAQQYYLTSLILLPNANLMPTVYADPYLLEIVPCPNVNYVARTSLRDAKDGKELAETDPATVLGDRLASSFNIDSAAASKKARAVIDGDPLTFGGGTCDIDCEVRWTTAVNLLSSLGLSVGHFRAPDRYFKFFDYKARAGILDDGKSTTLVISDPKAGVTATGLLGTLTLSDPAKVERPVLLYAKSAVVDVTGRTATLTFPSFAAVCGATKDKPCDLIEADLLWSRPSSRWKMSAGEQSFNWSCGQFALDPTMRSLRSCLGLGSVKATPLPPPVSLSVASGRVVLNPPHGGVFNVTVRFPAEDPKTGPSAKPPSPVAFSVEGADAVVTGPHQVWKDTYWLVDADTVLTVTVTNAAAGSTIRVKATAIDEKTRKPSADPDASVSKDILVTALQLPAKFFPREK